MNLSNYTVRLWVTVPEALVPAGWAWGPLERYCPAASEYVNSDGELRAVLRTYGRVLARLILPAEGDRFAVSARTLSGVLVGRDQWLWDDLQGAYVAHGEPFSVWGARGFAKAA
jgi:hypothetical protein